MYNAQIVKERIKEQQKIKNIKNADDMMNELGLGINIIRQMSDKKGVGCFALAKIADRLDCSVDYLLGRTDNPDNVGGTYINGNNNNNGTQAINGNVSVNTNTTEQDDKQLLELIKSLSLVERAEAIIYLNNLKTKK